MPRRQILLCCFGISSLRKFSPVFYFPLLALAAQGASFVNDQAARAVIGQDGFTDSYVAPLNGTVQLANGNILGGASGLAYANGTLYVADSNRLGALPLNNRVLGFSTTQIPSPQADVSNAVHPSPECWLCGYNPFVVIGQQDYSTTLAGRDAVPNSAGGSLNSPTAVAISPDGRTFAVADTNNNRVLIWNTPPANQTTPPNVVLGQANFTAFASPQVVNANSLRGPQGVWILVLEQHSNAKLSGGGPGAGPAKLRYGQPASRGFKLSDHRRQSTAESSICYFGRHAFVCRGSRL